jgi:hypothetical protein
MKAGGKITRPAFRQSDVKRALAAARQANFDVAACVIALNGSIRLTFREANSRYDALGDWDDVLQ